MVGGTASFITIVAVNHTDWSITISGGTEMSFRGGHTELGSERVHHLEAECLCYLAVSKGVVLLP